MDVLGEVSKIYEMQEFKEYQEYLDDPDVAVALDLIVKFIAKPDIAPAKAVTLINKLDALAAKFGVLATYYSTIGRDGKVEIQKKNMYYTLKDSMSNLSSAVKYSAKLAHTNG